MRFIGNETGVCDVAYNFFHFHFLSFRTWERLFRIYKRWRKIFWCQTYALIALSHLLLLFCCKINTYVGNSDELTYWGILFTSWVNMRKNYPPLIVFEWVYVRGEKESQLDYEGLLWYALWKCLKFSKVIYFHSFEI